MWSHVVKIATVMRKMPSQEDPEKRLRQRSNSVFYLQGTDLYISDVLSNAFNILNICTAGFSTQPDEEESMKSEAKNVRQV